MAPGLTCYKACEEENTRSKCLIYQVSQPRCLMVKIRSMLMKWVMALIFFPSITPFFKYNKRARKLLTWGQWEWHVILFVTHVVDFLSHYLIIFNTMKGPGNYLAGSMTKCLAKLPMCFYPLAGAQHFTMPECRVGSSPMDLGDKYPQLAWSLSTGMKRFISI